MILKAMKFEHFWIFKNSFKKNSLKKKTNFKVFPRSEIFQNSKVWKFSKVHVKNNEFRVLNTNFKIENLETVVSHLRLGWTFEPRPIFFAYQGQTSFSSHWNSFN